MARGYNRTPGGGGSGGGSGTSASKGYGGDIPDAAGYLAPTIHRNATPVDVSDKVTQFATGHGWTGSTGFATDTVDFITGTQSVKMTTASTATYKIESPALSLDSTAKQMRVRIKVPDITYLQGINAYLSNDSGYVNAYKWGVQGATAGSNLITSGTTTAQRGWVTLILNVADAQVIGTPTRTGITRIKFEVISTSAVQPVTLQVDEVDLLPEPTTLFPNGAVVICFDDSWLTSWTAAKPIMDAYRFRASNFVITDAVGTGGRLTIDDLLAMQDEGHEINAHAYADADHILTYTGMTAAQLDADLRAQKAWLRANGFKGECSAYPLGQYGVTADGVSTSTIMRRYFACARSTTNNYQRPGATYPIADPFRVPGLSGISTFAGGTNPSVVLATNGTGSLDAVKANHAVKVLTFHKVVTTPAGTDEIAVTDFQSIIDGIASRGMTVLTLGELFRR